MYSFDHRAQHHHNCTVIRGRSSRELREIPGVEFAGVLWITTGPDDIGARLTHNPVTSQNHPDCEDWQHEPTVDSETDSAMMFEPAAMGSTKLNVTSEPRQRVHDQVCEPALLSNVEGALVEYNGIEVSPAHPLTTESEFLVTELENCFDFGEVDCLPPLLSPEPVCSPLILLVPPTFSQTTTSELVCFLSICLSLQSFLESLAIPATQSSLTPISPSVPPHLPLSGMDKPWD